MKPVYPPERYVCRITGQGLNLTSKKNVQLVLSFLVLGTPDPSDPTRYQPVKVSLERRFYRVLNDNTMSFALEDLRTLGFEGSSFSQLDPKHPKAFSFKDLVIDMNCQHVNDQNGELKEDWEIARSRPLVQEEATPDKLRELDYVFGKQLAGLKQQQKPKQEAAPVTAGRANLEVDDNDIPF